jgi:hypothetical protein
MPRRQVTVIVVDAEGQLVYTIEDRPKPGAPPLGSVMIVLGAEEHHPQRPELESKPADPD